MLCKVINSTKDLLEEKINNWLKTGKYEISHILQSNSDIYITVTIFYLEKNEIRTKKLNNLNNKKQ
jgi:hypothetical protein